MDIHLSLITKPANYERFYGIDDDDHVLLQTMPEEES